MEGALGQKDQILKRTLNGELMAEYADFILVAWRKGEGMGGGVPPLYPSCRHPSALILSGCPWLTCLPRSTATPWRDMGESHGTQASGPGHTWFSRGLQPSAQRVS